LVNKLTDSFIQSCRDGLSAETLKFYRGYLNQAKPVIGTGLTGHEIKQLLDSLQCNNGGKHAYYRCLRAFYNWLYPSKSGYNLNPQDNPILMVNSPKVDKRILPSLSTQQIAYLMEQVQCVRDKAIISLFGDSGLRLSELAAIRAEHIDWNSRLIRVRCKGNKEGWVTKNVGCQEELDQARCT